MHVAQLMASPFFGGPERQMLGLALALPRQYRTTFLTFSESGKCRPLLEEVRRHGLEGIELEHNFPRIRRAAAEVAGHLRRLRADVLCCSGYKPDLIGWLAARQARVPVVSVSHGWTGVSFKVRCNEALDKFVLRWMDAIVCVSEGQAHKVRRAGAPADRIHVIRNAVSLQPLAAPDSQVGREIAGFFASPRSHLIVAAGRLSPEKGFDKLVEAAALMIAKDSRLGFVIFGEGPLRGELTRLIARLKVQENLVLPGFRANLEQYLPHFAVCALSSHTEGLPVIVLEAFAASLPVVGTAVGGVPEVIEDGINGWLVPPGDAPALARRLFEVLGDESHRVTMGRSGREHVRNHFTFAAQSTLYERLFQDLAGKIAGGGNDSPQPNPLEVAQSCGIEVGP